MSRYNLHTAEKTKGMDVVQQQAGVAGRYANSLPSPTASLPRSNSSTPSTPG